MTVEEQQNRNMIVIRIRELQDERDQQGGLGFEKTAELKNLQLKANVENWMYW